MEGVTNDSSSIQLNANQSQYVTIPPLFIPTDGMTFTFWIQSNNNTVNTRIFDFGIGAGNNNIICCIGNNNNLCFCVYNGLTNGGEPCLVPNINNNTWYFIAWTLSPSGGWNIYLNGVLYAIYSTGLYPQLVELTTNYIGKSNWSNPYYTGNIADFRMYSGIVSASDIQSIYTSDLASSVSQTGDALINTGFNQLYNQIFCNLYPTNDGFNQCKNCNFGTQTVNIVDTQNGEQNCLNACNSNKYCTAYSYNTQASSNNCTQYSSFPDQIVDGVNDIHSGYTLSNYTFDYNDLSPSQQINVQTQCIAQYLNNYFTPNNEIDVTTCITLSTTSTEVVSTLNNSQLDKALCAKTGKFCEPTTTHYSTNIAADPQCIYNLYSNNGLNPPSKINENYFNGDSYNLNSQGDPIISNYDSIYTNYTDNINNISNINNSSVPSEEDIYYDGTVSMNNNNLLNKYQANINEMKQELTNNLIESF